MYPTETNIYTPIIARVLRIQDITIGDPKQKFLYRYRGELYGDSAEAYDRLADSLRPLNVTPLFRSEDGLHVIYIESGTFTPRPSNPWINLILFGLTLLSVLFAGAFFSGSGPAINSVRDVIPALLNSLPFAVSLLAILGAHEFGHYLVGRYHKTQVSLPYFFAFPSQPTWNVGGFHQYKGNAQKPPDIDGYRHRWTHCRNSRGDTGFALWTFSFEAGYYLSSSWNGIHH